MSTRADFYVGRGESAEWLGSIAMDGYPDGMPLALLRASGEETFRDHMTLVLQRKDATLPEQGWPWPWKDSRNTDYAYAFDGGKVHASCFGTEWFDPMGKEPKFSAKKVVIFPNMEDRASIATPGTDRSGALFMVSDDPNR